MKKPREIAPPGLFLNRDPGDPDQRNNYSAFFSSFLSSDFLDFLAFFSFLAGASAAGASSALATVQLVGRRTARARKTTRVSFIGISLIRFWTRKSSAVTGTWKQRSCQVRHPFPRIQDPLNLGRFWVSGRRPRPDVWRSC